MEREGSERPATGPRDSEARTASTELRPLEVVSRWLSGAGAAVAATATVALMVVTCSDVLRRSISDRSVPGAIEYGEVLLVFAAFLGLGAAQRDGSHVSTTIVSDRLRPRAAKALHLTGLLLSVLLLVWVLEASSREAFSSWVDGEFRFGLVQVPLWPGRVALAVGFLILLIEMLRMLYRELHSKRTDDDRDGDTDGQEAE